MSPINAVSTSSTASQPELDATFRKVVGSVFYGQMLKSLRESVGKPAYIHGGQTEELFQSQLDQYVVDDLAGREKGPWIDELFRLFQTQLNQRAAEPSQLHQPSQPAGSSPQAELAELSRRTQPASDVAGTTTGAAALSALIRK